MRSLKRRLEIMEIAVKMREGAKLPSYQSEGAAGADVSAALDSPVAIRPGEWTMIPTGLFLEIPAGFEIQVRPRSGLAARHGVTVLNSPGTIDSDYRGEVQVILINHGKDDFIVHPGDRIAQLVAASVVKADFIEADELAGTERGEGGFGSTGV